MLQKQKIVHLFYGKTRRKKGKQKGEITDKRSFFDPTVVADASKK